MERRQWYLLHAVVVAVLTTIVVGHAAGQEPRTWPSTDEVKAVLARAGVLAGSVARGAERYDGMPPVAPRQVLDVIATVDGGRWQASIDSESRVVALRGGVPAAPLGGDRRIDDVEAAVRMADEWFSRLGHDVAQSAVYDAWPVGNLGEWRVLRTPRWGRDCYLQACAWVRLSASTGGLLAYHEPPQVVKRDLPEPLIDATAAAVRAVAFLAAGDEHESRPEGDLQRLWIVRTVALRRRDDDQYEPRGQWRVVVTGTARHRHGTSTDYRCVWSVYVDDQDGATSMGGQSSAPVVFIDGKAVRW